MMKYVEGVSDKKLMIVVIRIVRYMVLGEDDEISY